MLLLITTPLFALKRSVIEKSRRHFQTAKKIRTLTSGISLSMTFRYRWKNPMLSGVDPSKSKRSKKWKTKNDKMLLLSSFGSNCPLGDSNGLTISTRIFSRENLVSSIELISSWWAGLVITIFETECFHCAISFRLQIWIGPMENLSVFDVSKIATGSKQSGNQFSINLRQ